MKIAISTESTVDLTPELAKTFNIEILPLYVRLGSEELLDGTFPCEKIFDYVKNTKQLPKTSAINEYAYHEHFENLRTKYDAVIHFVMSSGISSSINHAKKAAERLENVFVIDSKSLSTGIALQCVYAHELLKNKKLTVQQIYKKCLARVDDVQASFVLNELNYLYKGGRCNSLQYLGANILKIKPQIIVENGIMRSNKKFMCGVDASFMKYVNATLEQFNKPDLENVFITYTTCKEEIIEQVKTKLIEKGFKNIYITRASATITSYCGENCLGILYFNKKGDNRKNEKKSKPV